MHRHSRFLTAGATALAALLLSGLVAFANVPVVQVSSDPYTNNTSAHATEVEPDTFAFGATVVSAFQVGRFYDGGASNIGWATSTDLGATWAHGFMPGTTVYATPPGPFARVSDPAVAYDAMHNVWMVISLSLQGGGAGYSVLISRSTDGGLTWLNPVTAWNPAGGLDKTWIVCDSSGSSPYFGHCYAEWDNTNAGNRLQMSTSTDGGLTWGSPLPASGNPSGLGGQPVVQPNGTVIVPYSGNYGSIGSFLSSNGGTSWNAAVTVATVTDHSVAGPLRAYPMPSAEISPGGRVYVFWHDCRFRSGCASNDIVFSSSSNGTTWSAVTRVPIDPVSSTVDHFLPGIGVEPTRMDPRDHLGLTYYYYPQASCTASTCDLTVGYISSPDGGLNWTTPTQVAGPMHPSWLPQTNQGYMVGDYISTSYTKDGKAHPVFAVANAPNGSVYDEAMYTPVPGLGLPLALSPAGARLVPAGGEKPVFFAPSGRPLLPALPTAH